AAVLGSGAFDKKVWARSVTLTGGTPYSFTLTNPASADYDLYLYADMPVSVDGSDGEPQIVASSTQAGSGGCEVAHYTPAATGRFYVVVKFVAGAGGAFQLTSTSAADFALSVSPGTQRLEATGESVVYTVWVTALGSFGNPVSLSVTGTLPAGVTAQF